VPHAKQGARAPLVLSRIMRDACALSLLLCAAWCAPSRADGFSSAPTLQQGRFGHTATLLNNGSTLVVGGATISNSLPSTELLAAGSAAWQSSGSLNAARAYHTATLLASGKVLVAGGQSGNIVLDTAEIYDPTTGNWSGAGTLNTPRTHHAAVLLNSGQVMVLGGTSGDGTTTLATPELYDPTTNSWTNAASATARWYQAASLLPNGNVLVSGGAGSGNSALASADIYSPGHGWTASVGSMITARMDHTATTLSTGAILVAGGFNGANAIGTGEIYSINSNSWLGAGTLGMARSSHTSTLLSSGKVLVVGGVDASSNPLASAEIFDPSTNAWTGVGSLQVARAQHTATLTVGSRVLIVGGQGVGPTHPELANCELYTIDPVFGNGFECSSGGPYGGGEAAGQGGGVTATIVDQTGAAVSNQPTYICGLDLCSTPQQTNSSGSVSYSTTLNMTKPAFKFGDTVNYAAFAIPVTPDSTTNFGTLQTGKFPALGSGSTLTPGTSAVSGDVTVSLAAGATVGIDTLTYSTSDEQKLRTVDIPVTAESSLLLPCANCGFQLLYGVAPAETTICPAAKVTVALPHQTQTPNDFGWAPGAAIEFWVTTLDAGQQYAPYAGWRKISGGTVSADGTSASTNLGEGFNFLESFAVRLRP
jgi:Galactose oxidase, central domain/Kelch motif